MRIAKGWFHKNNIWFTFLITAALLFVLATVYNYASKRHEGFTAIAQLNESYSLKQDQDVYDDFYTDVLDQLVPESLCKEEVDAIVQNTQSTPESAVILDIGSKHGLLLMEFKRRGYRNIYGIDKHKVMVDQTNAEMKENILCANPLDKMQFDHATFSHVLCLHQSLYEIPDLSPFFQNVWYWLKPGGVFVVHLVQYDKKPPKVTMAMPAKMHYERTVHIESSSQSMRVYETFTDRITNHVRQQEQHLHYQNIDRVMNAAFYQGFRINGKIEIKSPNVPRETREFIYFLIK